MKRIHVAWKEFPNAILYRVKYIDPTDPIDDYLDQYIKETGFWVMADPRTTFTVDAITLDGAPVPMDLDVWEE